MAKPEVWLRGPVEGCEPLLMPVVHTLMQVREDVERLASSTPPGDVWSRPGGAASIGFHVRHLGGALDRLMTYARGEALTRAQWAAARSEGEPGDRAPSLGEVALATYAALDRALEQLRGTASDDLLTPRKVGRAGLPSTTLGLLFHAAEHSARHAGQAVTTAKILAGGKGA